MGRRGPASSGLNGHATFWERADASNARDSELLAFSRRGTCRVTIIAGSSWEHHFYLANRGRFGAWFDLLRPSSSLTIFLQPTSLRLVSVLLRLHEVFSSTAETILRCNCIGLLLKSNCALSSIMVKPVVATAARYFARAL